MEPPKVTATGPALAQNRRRLAQNRPDCWSLAKVNGVVGASEVLAGFCSKACPCRAKEGAHRGGIGTWCCTVICSCCTSERYLRQQGHMALGQTEAPVDADGPSVSNAAGA